MNINASLVMRVFGHNARQQRHAILIENVRQALDGNGRVVVRYSGTESKIRLLVEASESAMVDAWIAKLTLAVAEGLG